MFDNITNLLLSVLIALMAWMGKSLYAKIEVLIAEIRAIMLSDVMNKKDIETLKEKVDHHEERISSLENKHI